MLPGQITVNGMADGKLCRLKLGDIYYFEVVDGSAFFYCQKEVFSSKQKLYEFEALCVGTMLFRCSKSMILNAGKIDYVLPSLSGRFEAALDNGEKSDHIPAVCQHAQTAAGTIRRSV